MIQLEAPVKPSATLFDSAGRPTLVTGGSNATTAGFSMVDGEEPPISFWTGASLKHLGVNPYGGNMWRVVWSETRYFMFSQHNDGRYMWLPMYQGKKCFMLERWLSAWQFSKCSPETWNLKNKDQGPYPERGVYFGPCWEFEGVPTLGAIESIISLIVQGDQYSEAQKAAAIVQAQERDDALRLNTAKEVILDALPLSATSGKLTNRFYNDAENIPQRLSAQDLAKRTGLPIGKNKVFTSGAERIEP